MTAKRMDLTDVELAVLRQMWSAGATACEIATTFSATQNTVYALAKKYNLPKRVTVTQSCAESPEEDAASAGSLALAPWVELRARPLREAHMAARAAETEEQTSSKVSVWNPGIYAPQGGRAG